MRKSMADKGCLTCNYWKINVGGHCYMFKSEPQGEFCGQHSEVQKAIRSTPLLRSMSTIAAAFGADLQQ